MLMSINCHRGTGRAALAALLVMCSSALSGAQIPAPPRPALRREFHDLVKQQHASASDRRCAHVYLGSSKASAKALHHSALGKGRDLRSAKAAALTGYGTSYYINLSLFFAFAMLLPPR